MSDFKAKMHQIRFRPDPAGGAVTAAPDPSAGFKGAASRQGWETGRDGERGEGRGGRGGGEEEGREREGMEEERGKGDRGNRRDGTGHGMRREGMERRKWRDRQEKGYCSPNFNSWRRHCWVCISHQSWNWRSAFHRGLCSDLCLAVYCSPV